MSGAVVCAQSSEPAASYIFPAGAQRGQTVDVRVGGLCLLKNPWFAMLGDGVEVPERLRTEDTVWFDGPMLTGQPSLEPDKYPKDHKATFTVAEDAPLGARSWSVWTSQGATKSRPFVVGDLPEVVEREIDGDPIPVEISVPATANGRIFPRADFDIWTFDAVEGETYAIELSARSILSPLDARIALYADGQMQADDIGAQNRDPAIQFQATVSGRHEVYVHDVGYGGSQSCVYRLTIRKGVRTAWIYPLGGRAGSTTQFELGTQTSNSNPQVFASSVRLNARGNSVGTVRHVFTAGEYKTEPVRLEVSDQPERIEVEPNDERSDSVSVAGPVVLNGRIDQPGDVDYWPLEVSAGQRVTLRLSAGRLGSRLIPSIAIVDADGHVVAPSDAQPLREEFPSCDVSLTFEVPEDGIYWARVKDCFDTRGGPQFGYRLQCGTVEPDFRLYLGTEAITAFRGKEASLPLQVERFGGLTGPIAIEVSGLPPETSLSELLIPADKDELSIVFKPSETAPIGGHRLQIQGTHMSDGATTRRVATKRIVGTDDPVDSVLLCVAVETPFKIKNRGPYYARVHAGTVYRHPFSLIRNGYEGPVAVRVADRQRRHLQGAQGIGDFVVPAGVVDFEFPFYLPPGMSRDRLGRCLVMAIGEVVDEKGDHHQVVFTDGEESQAPINTKAGRLSLVAEETSIFVHPNSIAEIAFNLQRDARLQLSASVELIVPEHITGIQAAPITLAPTDAQGKLVLEIGPEPGPFNMPLMLRATIIENGDRVVAEHAIAVVSASQEE